jgi:hypothetical protein
MNYMAVSLAATVAGESPVVVKPFDPRARTAVILVNGFNGLGLHTLFGVIRLFGSLYRNFVYNFAAFAVQRQFYYQGYPFLILPIRI